MGGRPAGGAFLGLLGTAGGHRDRLRRTLLDNPRDTRFHPTARERGGGEKRGEGRGTRERRQREERER